jgi:hypothetical protein
MSNSAHGSSTVVAANHIIGAVAAAAAPSIVPVVESKKIK